MKKYIVSLVAVLFVGALFLPSSVDAALPEGFSTEVVSGGLTLPTTFDFAPDGRIFVAEKNGTVSIIKNGEVLPTPFLTLTDINTWVDRGLLGIAIDPDFATNGWVYLSYTYENNPADYEGPKTARIVRVKASGDTMLPGSMEVLVGTVGGDVTTPSCNDYATGTDCIPSDSGSHSAGGLRFGPDGKLYATLGDGAGFDGVDPNAYKAQHLDWLTGKVLRLNTDGTAPADNPFYTGDPTANKSKIYSYGIRNSFRFDFRPSTGAMFLGEVGWGSFEEINVGAAGANFAWPCKEGSADQEAYECTPVSPVDPIHEYGKVGSSDAVAVVGGSFSGTAYPTEYQDNYIFGDFHRNDIYRMVVSPTNDVISVDTWLDDSADGPVSILAGPDGSIYYIAIFTGELRRIVHEDSTTTPAPPIARDDSASTLEDTTVIIDVLVNDSDPNGDPIDVVSATTPANGSVLVNADDTITYTPDTSFIGLDTFMYTLSDGALIDTATVTVDVREGGDPALVVPTHLGATRDNDVPVVGQLTTFTTTLRNDGLDGPMLIDFELYEVASGTRVALEYFDNEFIAAGATSTYQFSWIPEVKGQYRLSVGYFEPGWENLHSWIDDAMTFTVLDREPVGGPLELVIDSVTVSDPFPSVGESVTVSATVTNKGGDGFGLVDIEIFDDLNVQVGQMFYDNEAFLADETRTFTMDWTPTSTGQFWAEVGIFGAGWDPFFDWAWHGASIQVTDAAPGTGVPIWTDALAFGWNNWSWDTTERITTTPLEVYEGTQAFEATMSSPWAGIYLRTDNTFSVDTVSNLTFAIRSEAPAGQEIQVKVLDAGGVVILETLIDPLTTSWNEVSIPLASIPLGTLLSGIMIQGSSGTVLDPFLVDEIVFE